MEIKTRDTATVPLTLFALTRCWLSDNSSALVMQLVRGEVVQCPPLGLVQACAVHLRYQLCPFKSYRLATRIHVSC